MKGDDRQTPPRDISEHRGLKLPKALTQKETRFQIWNRASIFNLNIACLKAAHTTGRHSAASRHGWLVLWLIGDQRLGGEDHCSDAT